MIQRKAGCTGITLFRLGKRQLEVWFCPKASYIQPHTHPNIDCTLVFLWGQLWGLIGSKRGMVGTQDIGRRFPVPAGVSHSAYMYSFTIFANYERWKVAPTSAALDFVT